MELLHNLAIGFEAAGSLSNLAYCLIGVVLGTAIGVLPGLGPITTIALLLPLSFGLPATAALIMLAGIYYGAQYGGSTAAILVNLPGESSAVVTAIDGHQMARKGRAGHALAIAAIGSFVAGTIATVLIAVLSPTLAEFALDFGPADYFSLMLLGLIASVIIAKGSIMHALGMILLGILLGTVGSDVNSGVARFTFGEPRLFGGIDFVVVSVALFGLGEIIANLQRGDDQHAAVHPVGSLFPSKKDFVRSAGAILRGTGIGAILGILPGGGATLGSFAAYALEKRVSPNRAEFGHGAIEGVAAPESANNAGAQTSFIPMLTLGIPSNPVMALMIGAMIIQGIQPGPAMMTQQPDLFWGMIASMWIGNVFLLILNLPLIGIWVKMISVPYRYLFPMIVVFCLIGAFSISNSTFEIFLMAGFGVLGYVLRKFDCEPAPLILAFVLGPMIEEYLRRALLLSGGDPVTFLQRPISASLLALCALLLLLVLLPTVKRTREVAFEEDS